LIGPKRKYGIENAETLSDPSKAVGPGINAQKTKRIYIYICSCYHNSRHNYIMINRSFENVAEFKYFGTTITNPNHIHDKV